MGERDAEGGRRGCGVAGMDQRGILRPRWFQAARVR